MPLIGLSQNLNKPVLALNGAARIVIEAASVPSFTDPGVTATDPEVCTCSARCCVCVCVCVCVRGVSGV